MEPAHETEGEEERAKNDACRRFYSISKDSGSSLEDIEDFTVISRKINKIEHADDLVMFFKTKYGL